MAQPVHVQQLLKLKQQAVQQQKAIQPQAAPGPAAVQQKVLGSRLSPLYVSRAPLPSVGCTEVERVLNQPCLAAWPPHTRDPVVVALGCTEDGLGAGPGGRARFMRGGAPMHCGLMGATVKDAGCGTS